MGIPRKRQGPAPMDDPLFVALHVSLIAVEAVLRMLNPKSAGFNAAQAPLSCSAQVVSLSAPVDPKMSILQLDQLLCSPLPVRALKISTDFGFKS